MIDGGGINGKKNGDIPSYNANPGWNFGGNGTQIDYFDIPSNTQPAGAAETVAFETALVAYKNNIWSILAVWTWDFRSDGAGGVSGHRTARQASASNRMMNLYGNLLPVGGLLQNTGLNSALCACVPTPGTGTLLVLAGLTAVRRRRAA